MAYRACVIDRAYVLRWTAEPVLSDVPAIVHAVAAARRAAGVPILYLGIVAAEIPMPKSAVRDAFSNSFGVMTELCACIDVLIVDNDIRAMLLRALVRTMALAVPGGKVHCFASVDQLAQTWMRDYQVDAVAVLERFHEFERTKVA
jgi:hypothetical protein